MRISDWSSDVCSSDLSKIRRFWRRAFAGTTSLAFLISIARSRKFVLQSQHLLMIHFYERSNLLKINVPDRSHDHGVKGMKCLLRSEEHTSELQSLMRISYAVFCLKNKRQTNDA